jgi:hypothetical protein
MRLAGRPDQRLSFSMPGLLRYRSWWHRAVAKPEQLSAGI